MVLHRPIECTAVTVHLNCQPWLPDAKRPDRYHWFQKLVCRCSMLESRQLRFALLATADSSRYIRFGVFEVDLLSGELRKSGTKLKLGGQPLQILAILLEQYGEVVTREEFQKRL